MQYILSETEYQAFLTLKEENTKLAHKLAVAHMAREMDRRQIEELGHVHDLNNKKLAEQAHELLVKEAELADLSGKLREAKRDMEGTLKTLEETKSESLFHLKSAQNLQAEVERLEEERNALQASLEKTQRRIEHSEHLSERRLRLANELQTQVQRLKHEPVAIVLNPSTKRYRAVSLSKVGTYARFGWEVLADEGAPVDRPA